MPHFQLSASFIENLEAGFVFWIFDVLILVILVPTVFDRIEQKKWKPMRIEMIRSAADFYNEVIGLIDGERGEHHHFGSDYLMEKEAVAQRKIDLMSVCLTPAMAAPMATFLIEASNVISIFKVGERIAQQTRENGWEVPEPNEVEYVKLELTKALYQLQTACFALVSLYKDAGIWVREPRAADLYSAAVLRSLDILEVTHFDQDEQEFAGKRWAETQMIAYSPLQDYLKKDRRFPPNA